MDKIKILKEINEVCKNTLMELLEIEYIDIGEGTITATMPVNSRVHQPMGLLHGGASVALAESVGSMASHFFIDSKKFEVRGIEISANHLKSKRDGIVTATASIIHKGKRTHLWEIRIEDENKELISLCKMTSIILSKK
jgi:uncharacterized protein (TIGR00369 family)